MLLPLDSFPVSSIALLEGYRYDLVRFNFCIIIIRYLVYILFTGRRSYYIYLLPYLFIHLFNYFLLSVYRVRLKVYYIHLCRGILPVHIKKWGLHNVYLWRKVSYAFSSFFLIEILPFCTVCEGFKSLVPIITLIIISSIIPKTKLHSVKLYSLRLNRDTGTRGFGHWNQTSTLFVFCLGLTVRCFT